MLCQQRGVSRAEMVRQAIGELLKYSPPIKKPSESFKAAFGLFKDSDVFGDGLEYQLKIRSEWDEHDRAIDERLGLLPSSDNKLKKPAKKTK